MLNEALSSLGHETVICKAYGENEKAMFSDYVSRIDQVSLMFLFQAFHVEQCLRAIKEEAAGKIVLADRWDESYLAYHEQFGVLSSDNFLRSRLNQLAFRQIKPDLSFLLHLSAADSAVRRSPDEKDFFDRMTAEYHQKMSDRYNEIGMALGWVILDGSDSIGSIHQDILGHVLTAL